MGQTVIGSQSIPLPFAFCAPTIDLKENWGDDWQYEPELELVSASATASSAQVSSCEVRRRYGNVKAPYESNFAPRASWNLSGQWLRLSMIGAQGSVVQFVGQIDNVARKYMGSAAQPAGVQSWVVTNGLQILKRLDISQSYFLDADGENASLIGWIPAMNARDHRGLLVGNRSETQLEGVYLYGGKQVWTHLQYVQMLVKQFIQQVDGPTWTIGGQSDILDGMKTTIKFAASTKASEMLQHLIPVRYGVDYRVKATEKGFEIAVFALVAEETSVAGVTMPKNPDTVQVQKDSQLDLIQTSVVESTEKRVDSIRILGKRMVVCGTLRGVRADGNSLVKKWNDTIESEYAALRSDPVDSTETDKLRKRDRYRDVFQKLGAPADWDLDGGTWALQCGLDGQLMSEPGPFQNVIRNTLPWIPLKEGFDYSENPEVDLNISDQEPEVKPPIAWILDESPEDGDERYVQCDLHGISTGRPHLDWGVFLNASPNHKLALNHWSEDDDDSTDDPPTQYDYETVVATIAFESDQRLQLGFDVPENLQAGDGSVMAIVDEDAELWALLPSTIVDVDKDGESLDSGPVIRVLRNDSDRLALILAGALVKYINERVRAVLIFKGFVPWGDLVGSILTLIQQGDDVQRVGAPITSIEWIAGKSPQTIFRTGYA